MRGVCYMPRIVAIAGLMIVIMVVIMVMAVIMIMVRIEALTILFFGLVVMGVFGFDQTNQISEANTGDQCGGEANTIV